MLFIIADKTTKKGGLCEKTFPATGTDRTSKVNKEFVIWFWRFFFTCTWDFQNAATRIIKFRIYNIIKIIIQVKTELLPVGWRSSTGLKLGVTTISFYYIYIYKLWNSETRVCRLYYIYIKISEMTIEFLVLWLVKMNHLSYVIRNCTSKWGINWKFIFVPVSLAESSFYGWFLK